MSGTQERGNLDYKNKEYSMQHLKESLAKLVLETSTNLPPDVRRALSAAMKAETPATQSSLALDTIAINVDMACDGKVPICQDTGMPTFEIRTPVGTNQIEIARTIRDVIVDATKDGTLRPNQVDSLTGKNSGNNLGEGTPVIHCEQWEQEEIEVREGKRRNVFLFIVNRHDNADIHV